MALRHGEPFLFISRIFAGARRDSAAIARSAKNGRHGVSHGRRHGLCPCPFLRHAAYDGGAYRDRTDDLMLAKQPLSQLS